MADKRLINYIKANMANGASEEQVRKALGEVGWADNLIEEAFEALKEPVEEELFISTKSVVKESNSAKFMWFALISVIIVLLIAVVFYVVYNGNGKEGTSRLVKSQTAIAMEELSKNIDWLENIEANKAVDVLYEQVDQIESLDFTSKSKQSFAGEYADFVIINKTFDNSQELVYLAYRGKTAKCQFEKTYWETTLKELMDDFQGGLEKLKSGPACSGDFFEDDVIEYLGNQKFLNLNMTEEDLDMSEAKEYNLTKYKKDGLSLENYREMSSCEDMDCFIEKAKNCELVSYLEEGRWNMFFGGMMPEAIYREILGQEEDGRCIYSSSIVDIKFYAHPIMKNVLFSEIFIEGMTEEEENIAMEVYLNEMSTSFSFGSYCKYPTETLLAMLENEVNTLYSSDHFGIRLCRNLKVDGSIMTPQEMGFGEMDISSVSELELGESVITETPWEVWK